MAQKFFPKDKSRGANSIGRTDGKWFARAGGRLSIKAISTPAPHQYLLPNDAVRCSSHRSTLREPLQRTASGFAAPRVVHMPHPAGPRPTSPSAHSPRPPVYPKSLQSRAKRIPGCREARGTGQRMPMYDNRHRFSPPRTEFWPRNAKKVSEKIQRTDIFRNIAYD